MHVDRLNTSKGRIIQTEQEISKPTENVQIYNSIASKNRWIINKIYLKRVECKK